MASKEWYKKSAEEIIAELETGSSGLSDAESKKRLEIYGPNTLPESATETIIGIFFRQFKNPLIYLLLAAAAVVFFIEEYVDGFIILFVLLFNAIVGTVQAGRARNTLLALRKFATTSATVIRDDAEHVIPDAQVVPGDIIILQEGEKIPAGARLIAAHSLRVSEAALTGESEPVHKQVEVVSGDDVPLGDRKNMVFKGTHVVAGNGKAVVVETGLHTVIGSISTKMTTIDTEIPLQVNIRHLSHIIMIGVVLLSVGIFLLGSFLGKGAEEMFKLSVAVVISAIPEGLPIVMTLLLASGVRRMSKRNVLVKKLQAVEALGEASVIAVDKTGTLTKGEMVVQRVYVDGKDFEVRGVGYDPKGEVLLDGKSVNPDDHPVFLEAARAAICSADAGLSYVSEEKTWKVSGDPTEAALVVLAEKAGVTRAKACPEGSQLEDIPFDSNRKYHAALYQRGDARWLVVVGAPEIVLEMCGNLPEEERAKYQHVFEEMSTKGLRVVAFATRNDAPPSIDTEHIADLTFGGFYGMKDALKEEVHDAMAETNAAGIKVVMITGDYPITAEAIAAEAGIFKAGDRVLTGQEIDRYSEEELAHHLEHVSVFARVTPDHKLKIIDAYRLRGEVISMTGDGVNDALSLVAADLGVSMGKGGTEVAKEASDIVLLDDNFGSIVAAVEEGRNIYKNIKKVLLFLFSTNVGEIFIILGAIALQYPLPVAAVQLIWLNLITDGFLDVALALEPKEKGLLKDKFTRPSKWILDGKMVQRMLLMAITMCVGTLTLFSRYFETDLAKAMTIALTTMAVFQWFKVFNCRSDKRSIFRLNPFSNRFLVGALALVVSLQIIVMHMPFTQSILHLMPLSGMEWLMIIAVASSTIFVDETWKFFYRRFSSRKGADTSADLSPKEGRQKAAASV